MRLRTENVKTGRRSRLRFAVGAAVAVVECTSALILASSASATASAAGSATAAVGFTAESTGNHIRTLAESPIPPLVADATTTVVSGPTITFVGSPIVVTATVADAADATVVPTGHVQFQHNGLDFGAPVSLDADGNGSIFYIADDGAAQVFTARYIPNDPSRLQPSTDPIGIVVQFIAQRFSGDPQTLDVVVPPGSLVVSTPYTPEHPLHLGDLALSADGLALASASVDFGDPSAPGAPDPGPFNPTSSSSTANGLTITDTRSGSTGWQASAITTDFTDGFGHSIDGDALTFRDVTPKFLAGNHLTADSVATQGISHFKAAPAAFAQAVNGPGTVDITGKLALTAPTSTAVGTYTATITFTVI